MSVRTIFSHTPEGIPLPPYICVNAREDGAVSILVRDITGSHGHIVLPREIALVLALAMHEYAIGTQGAALTSAVTKS